jgi:hypothetical protein
LKWTDGLDTKTFTPMFSFPLPQTHNGTIMPNMTQLPPNNSANIDNATPASQPSVQSVQSIPESSNSGHSPGSRKRRREGDGARRIVVANFSNETDALEILANAATDDKKDGDSQPNDKGPGRKVTFEDKAGARLEDFALVKQGVLDVSRLEVLVRVFFEHHHPALVSLTS